jgi:hypothetical protein
MGTPGMLASSRLKRPKLITGGGNAYLLFYLHPAMAVCLEAPALLSRSLAFLVVRLEASLAVGFVGAPLGVTFGVALG